MSKIYQQAKDKNVATIMVYSDGTNVFYDAKKSTKVSFEDLADYFVKGMTVKNDSGVLFTPIAFKTDSTVNKVTIHDGDAKTELSSDAKSGE